MKFISISDAMKRGKGKVAVRGWIYRERGSNKMKFLVLRDASDIIQVVLDRKKFEKQWGEIQGLSIIEPPGHHAGKNFLGGFCYFNNIAEAVYRSKLKTLILDIDGHHGNGTQDIFYNSKNIFYVSLHQSPAYPGTGYESKNNILNYPLKRDCGEKIYIKTLEYAIEEASESFKFKQISVSAGFDTYQGDLVSLGLNEKSYYKIGNIIKNLAEKTNSRVFSVLEGGYTKTLGSLIHNFILGLEK